MDEIQDLLRALDEWEAADDRANEAAAAISHPASLSDAEFRELRTLQIVAAQKLEAVRRAVATEF